MWFGWEQNRKRRMGGLEKLILIRHTQSEANADNSVYGRVEDWKIGVTKRGEEKGVETGKRLVGVVGEKGNCVFVVSPFKRTMKTFQNVVKGMQEAGFKGVIKARHEPCVTEQQFGNFQNPRTMNHLFGLRQLYGRFFWRFPEGESGIHVYHRAVTFIDTILPTLSSPSAPAHVVVITHGLTLRALLMSFFWLSIPTFEKMRNPSNNAMVVISKDSKGVFRVDKKASDSIGGLQGV